MLRRPIIKFKIFRIIPENGPFFRDHWDMRVSSQQVRQQIIACIRLDSDGTESESSVRLSCTNEHLTDDEDFSCSTPRSEYSAEEQMYPANLPLLPYAYRYTRSPIRYTYISDNCAAWRWMSYQLRIRRQRRRGYPLVQFNQRCIEYW